MLGHAKQRIGQLYRCYSLLSEQDVCTLCKSWICPILTFCIQELPILTYADLIINSLVLSKLVQLLFNLFFNVDMLLLWVWCVVCWLEKDEGTYLPTYCPYLCGTSIHRRSDRLHSWYLAKHLHFVNPCNFIDLNGVGWLLMQTFGMVY